MSTRRATTKSSRSPQKGKAKRLTKAQKAKLVLKRQRAALKGSITRALKSGAKRAAFRAEYKAKIGRAPGPRQLDAFIAQRITYTKRAAKAKATREKKKALHDRRSASARAAAATRARVPKEDRAWLKARKKVQQERLDLVRAAQEAKPRFPKAFRWYDGIYYAVEDWTDAQLHALLVYLKRRGVKAIRFEREVRVGEYSKDLLDRSPSGYVSSRLHFLHRLTDEDLRFGRVKYGYPSIKSMRVPGVDFLKYVVHHIEQIQYLPQNRRRELFALPAETRDTVGGPNEEAAYLAKGRRSLSKDDLEATLAEIRERVSRIADEAEEDDEGEE